MYSQGCIISGTIFVPLNRNKFYSHPATYQGHFLSDETETCILTILQHLEDIFCPMRKKHVFSLCCIISRTFFVPLNRNMYSHYAASSRGQFLSHQTETCILTMLRHLRDNLCPIEQKHVFSLCFTIKI